jgi:hypothetical protein
LIGEAEECFDPLINGSDFVAPNSPFVYRTQVIDQRERSPL